jgi:flagellar motor switch protein FliG
MWEKLSNVQEEVLANYLKNEYPQTIAVVLSKLKPEHAARVLAILPEDMALDVVNRMLQDGSGPEGSHRACRADPAHRIHVQPVADPAPRCARGHGRNLQQFRPPDRNPLHHRPREENREAAERIKALMFTFDDLAKLDAGSAQTLMRHVDKDKLGIALKGANETVRSFFMGNMSSRAAKMLMDDMAAAGPVRLRDVDEAQALLVNLAKDLAAKGEIMLQKNRADDELVY